MRVLAIPVSFPDWEPCNILSSFSATRPLQVQPKDLCEEWLALVKAAGSDCPETSYLLAVQFIPKLTVLEKYFE